MNDEPPNRPLPGGRFSERALAPSQKGESRAADQTSAVAFGGGLMTRQNGQKAKWALTTKQPEEGNRER